MSDHSTTISLKQRLLIGAASGIYPFLHYYNGNFHHANSWFQFFLLLVICLLVPVALAIAIPYLFNISFLKKLKKYAFTGLNLVWFTGLMGWLIFHFKKEYILLLLVGVTILSLVLYKHIYKILTLQLLLAALSLIAIIPKLWFVANYDDSWSEPAAHMQQSNFLRKPNIYIIQPDGYANFSKLKEVPYEMKNNDLPEWLDNEGFVSYENFRSNYHSTLSSNASLFAMRHHYYKNNYRSKLKTYGAKKVIVGTNNSLRLLRHNGYKTHLFTNNSFFLVNRKNEGFDYCNIPQSQVPLFRPGGVQGIDIVSDFDKTMTNQTSNNNFYFIERIVPGHISNTKARSKGKEGERNEYFEGIHTANDWIKSIVSIINDRDENPLIVIVADHGGYVGLSYLTEMHERTLSDPEVNSIFSTILSIRWPNGEEPDGLKLKTNVNLFPNIFYYLSGDKVWLENLEEDKSFLPQMEDGYAQFYEFINEHGEVEKKKI